MKQTYKSTAKFLIENENYLVAIHDKADGDCFGSAIALCTLLKKLDKQAKVLSSSPIPERLEFINVAGIECIIGADAFRKVYSDGCTIISTDVASDQLLSELENELAGKIKFAIDHHKTNSITCENLLLDEKSSACGELIFNIAKELEKQSGKDIIDSTVAHPIYAAISSDTGSFKYANTTSTTHKIASQLMKYPINSSEISYKLFELKTSIQIAVEKLAYEKLEFLYDGKIGFISITSDELKKIGANANDTETISQIPKSVKGVQIGVFMRQKDKNSYKFSLRANTDADMSLLCSYFGGGGHVKAAGCTIAAKSPKKAKAIFMEKAKQFII